MDYKLRHVQERIRALSKYAKVILITGARQVGKSTLLQNLLPGVPMITFDRHIDSYGAIANPDLFLKTYPSPVILDEVQYVPQLLSTIKRKVDDSDEMGQYYLTGSHNLGLLKAAVEGMTGRVAIIDLEHLSPFEEAESFAFQGDEQSPPSWLAVYLKSPSHLVQNFVGVVENQSPLHLVWRGGFPATLDRPDRFMPDYFEHYVRSYLERDALYANSSTAVPQFTQFLSIMAALTGQEIKLESLSRDLGLKKSLVEQWEYVLRQTYQWREVPPYASNVIKRVVKSRKGYMTDTGLACYLQRITDPTSLLNHPLNGALFETYCVNLIFKLIGGLYQRPAVYHWRVPGGAEVDLVLHMNGKLYPIEIKMGTTLSKHDARGILAFRETYGEIVEHGIVLYPGDICYAIREDVTALPFNALMKPRVVEG